MRYARHVLVLFARNAAGNGPSVTREVTVGGTAAAGTYLGAFNTTMTLVRTFGGVTCTWQATYAGSMTIALTQAAAGLSATIRVAGSRSEPRGSTSTPNFECLAGSETFDETSPAIISGTNIARTGIAMTHSTGTFSGTLGSTSIPGTPVHQIQQR